MFQNKTVLNLAISFCFLIITSCNTSKSSMANKAIDTTKMPKELLQGIEAHGGLDQWNNMQTWAYTIERNGNPERHFIDLKSRKVLLTQKDYTVGFDGKEVWITPNKAAFGEGSPRFFHNLYFYFHAFPFVMTDPGINYEVLPQKEMNGKLYDAVKISYDPGVGDAPDDYYIAHFDTQTHQMYLLLYTVTYFKGQPGTKFSAIVMDDWIKVNGLLVPNSMKGYKYADGQLGDQRYTRNFDNIALSTKPADPAKFVMPAGAEVDPLIVH